VSDTMDRQSADRLLERFDTRSRRLEADDPEWLRPNRAAGRSSFSDLGVPTTRNEAWRSTNISSIVNEEFVTSDFPAGSLNDAEFDGDAGLDFGGPRIVLTHGRFDPEHSRLDSLPKGLFVGRLGDAPDKVRDLATQHFSSERDRQSFRALNDALFDDAALIHVGDGCSIAEPIEIQHRLRADSVLLNQCRNLVIVGDGCSVTVIERYFGAGESHYLNNCVTDWKIGDRSNVKHYRVQHESPVGYHIATTESVQGRDSHHTTLHVDLGSQLSRHDIRAVLDGEGGYCDMGGLYVTRDRQHVDNHTVIDHARPNCGSRELFKGILDDKSRTVFNGRIIVREDAQKIDAKQSNPNILLSKTALAQTRPQLEIYADDVKCTHGATIGQLDDDAIFYMRSRGIPVSEARRLMLASFAGEVLDKVDIEPLRESLEKAIAERLPAVERSA